MYREKSGLLSHQEKPEDVAVEVAKIRQQILLKGELPYASVDYQLSLLEQLMQFELGRFLIVNKGLNGYWTHYILTYPDSPLKTVKTELELFLLERAPVILATQERFKIFLAENQLAVKNGAKLACIPSGLLGELLYLNFENINDVELVGIDLDQESLTSAKSLAESMQLNIKVSLTRENAWQIKLRDELDLISSNGLNIYEPDEKQVVALFQKFYTALKPNGKLVTSYLTFPPISKQNCEWEMNQINQADLLKQKIILADILQAKWQCFTSTETITQQLKSVGFENIRIIYDKAKIFPTIVAEKLD